MKTLEQVATEMKRSLSEKKHFFHPVVALGINSNIHVFENAFFEDKDEALEFAKEQIDNGFRLKVGFEAQEYGYCRCIVESIGYGARGPHESRIVSSVSYQL